MKINDIVLKETLISSSNSYDLREFKFNMLTYSTIKYRNIQIDRMPNLRSLDGLPEFEINKLSITDCPNLHDTQHICGAKSYEFISCENLKTISGLRNDISIHLEILYCDNINNITFPKKLSILKLRHNNLLDLINNKRIYGTKIYLDFGTNRDLSFNSFDKLIRRCLVLSIFTTSTPNKCKLLSILQIKDLKEFKWSSAWGFSPKFELALNILQKYIGQEQSAILQCQTELIENNLEEYAYL